MIGYSSSHYNPKTAEVIENKIIMVHIYYMLLSYLEMNTTVTTQLRFCSTVKEKVQNNRLIKARPLLLNMSSI